jgi:hypothetical protein
MEYDMSDPRIRELLEGLDEPEDEPPPPPQPPQQRPRPRPRRTGRYEPTAEEWRCYCELSERGSFRPLTQLDVPKPRPGHTRDRWGKAVGAEWQKKPGKIQ